MIVREEILENLKEGICRITFRKVTDGKYRILYCTLFQEDLPHIEKDKLILAEILSAQKNPNLLTVWDVVNNDWRSFYINTIFKFVPDVEKFQSDTKDAII